MSALKPPVDACKGQRHQPTGLRLWLAVTTQSPGKVFVYSTHVERNFVGIEVLVV